MTQSASKSTISQEQWLEIVRQVDALEPDPPARRHHLRFDLENASAMVRFARKDRPGPTVERMCSLLEVSDPGLMLRSREEIPQHASVFIEAYIGDEVVNLAGTVMHCTATVGAFKIGVRLDF